MLASTTVSLLFIKFKRLCSDTALRTDWSDPVETTGALFTATGVTMTCIVEVDTNCESLTLNCNVYNPAPVNVAVVAAELGVVKTTLPAAGRM